MAHPRPMVALLAGMLLVIPARIAYADALEPVLLPGLFQLWGLVTIPVTILIAVIERPFVTQAGVTTQALFHSFCANVLSAIAGFALLFVIPDVNPDTFGWLILGAFALSIAIEGIYYQVLPQMRSRRIKWGMVALGNVASGCFLFSVTLIITGVGKESPRTGRRLAAYQKELIVLTAVAASVGFLFGLRRIVRRHRMVRTTKAPKIQRREEISSGFGI